MNTERIPQDVKAVLDLLVERLRSYLDNELVGVYLHGSLAMSGFNPVSSDIDILIVVKNKLNVDSKKEMAKIFVELSESAPAKGFEVSMVTIENLKSFIYPTPYEFHFSLDMKEQFEKGEIDFVAEKTDPDLAAHFVITKKRGICLYGTQISDIFPDVPRQYYLDSIAKDSEWSFERILGSEKGLVRVPSYGVLNFCRVLALIQDDIVTSKIEGGEWGIQNLPKDYAPLIKEALKEKRKSGTSELVEVDLIKQFAHYAIEIIRQTEKESK